MTNEQKEKIAELRTLGYSCSKIGDELGISKNTVKTYCRRHNLSLKAEEACNSTSCRNCGKSILQREKQKKRIFCSKECRENWWHAHPEQLQQKAVYEYSCAGCGKTFTAYGNSHRKYCSHECYIKTRFNGGDSDE